MLKLRTFLCLFIVILFSGGIDSNKLPKSWKVCKKGGSVNMDECIKEAMQNAVLDLTDGKPSLGVLPLEPLRIDSLVLQQGNGPVNITLLYTNLTLSGFKDFKMKSVRWDDWKKMEFEFSVPSQIVLDSHYSIDGKILVLPIKGSGHCKIVFDNYSAKNQLKFKEIEKNGKKYYEITSFDLFLDADKVHTQFDNLFNGNKALGDNMNAYLNENWKEILIELRPAISTSFGAAYKEVGNRILSKVPIEELTPD